MTLRRILAVSFVVCLCAQFSMAAFSGDLFMTSNLSDPAHVNGGAAVVIAVNGDVTYTTDANYFSNIQLNMALPVFA